MYSLELVLWPQWKKCFTCLPTLVFGSSLALHWCAQLCPSREEWTSRLFSGWQPSRLLLQCCVLLMWRIPLNYIIVLFSMLCTNTGAGSLFKSHLIQWSIWGFWWVVFLFNAEIFSGLHCCHSMCFCGLQIRACCAFHQSGLFYQSVSGCCVNMHVVKAMTVIHYTQSGMGEYTDFFAKVLFGSGGTLWGNLRNDAKNGCSYSSVNYILIHGCNLQSKIHHWLHMSDSCGS